MRRGPGLKPQATSELKGSHEGWSWGRSTASVGEEIGVLSRKGLRGEEAVNIASKGVSVTS